MKYKFLSGCLALALCGAARGQTADFYVNDGVVNCPPQTPPQVDATNFVNNNFFSINFTTFTENSQRYKTANTLNFTNTGLMIGNTGFEFDTGPGNSGLRRMAANFNNSGTISCGSVNNTNSFFNFFFFGFGFGGNFLPKLFISATNVVMNSSTNVVGVNGLFRLSGKNVDLNRAAITIEGFEDTATPQFFVSTVGQFDQYWGVGTNVMNPLVQFEIPPPQTPFHIVTNASGFIQGQVLTLPAATAYVRDIAIGTNRFVQAVFLNNTNSAISNNVYFPFLDQIDVEWIAIHTNAVTGSTATSYLYLFDDFGNFATNRVVANISGLTTPVPTYIPTNYTFFRGGPLFLGTPAPSGLPPFTFNNSTVTNDYAAYGALFGPTTQLPGNVLGGTITNLPSRIEITADNVLNLSRTRISGPNYMNLKAPNHFAGSSRAQISVPLSDIYLASTNGNMTITNLLAATVPRFTGEVDLWSGRWTNNAGGFLSRYHVLFVDSRLSPNAPSLVQDLTLRSTNVVINDVMNVTRSFLIEAEHLTVATNQAPAPTASGEINLRSSQITWSTATPRLQYLTNNGAIRSLNAVFFGGSRSTPFFTSTFNEPYVAFVNRGTVETEGSLIWANYFENSGLFSSGLNFGSLTLQSQAALLTNGSFIALHGDISITSGDLVVSNHVLQAGRTLTLSVTNLLTDAVTNTVADTNVSYNTWSVGRGFNLPVKPVSGDLLGTTILELAGAGAENGHFWAAADRGCAPAGFKNNSALGRLILDGANDSQFTFTGTGTSNALYVDYLELKNFSTNIDFSGNLFAVQIDPNMMIYYAQAVIGGVSVAERLSGANGGRFCWVSNYAGIYSSTNIVYPNGSTNSLNAALVQSKNQDSDCDGLPNSSDGDPLFLVTTVSLPEATNGAAYLATLQAGGGVPPFTWALAPGSAALPAGLSLSPAGVISGTPTLTGSFAFTARATQTPCALTADRDLTVNVAPGGLLLSVAIETHSPKVAHVSWQTKPFATNFVYYRPSLGSGNWQLLTNFVVPVGGTVSVFDPVSTNATRFYRVHVSTGQ